MKVERLQIPDLLLLTPVRHDDERGFFSETYRRDLLAEAGFTEEFVQDNHSLSRQRGVLRGLHFQTPPCAQAKLVRVVRGAILDVAVDIRKGSPTFGQHVAVELSAANWRQLLIPVGFAHGFCTLEENTEVIYKVSSPYSPAHERGLAFDDPALGIEWPFPQHELTLSARDRRHPVLHELTDYFHYVSEA